MKRHVYLLLLIFINTTIFSQEKKDQIIKIDPFGINSYHKKYDFGSTVKFQIKNVNVIRLRSTGKIEGAGKSLNFEIPKVFKDILAEESNDSDDKLKTKYNLYNVNSEIIAQSNEKLQQIEDDNLRLIGIKNTAKSINYKNRIDAKIKENEQEIEKLKKLIKEMQTLLASTDSFLTSKKSFLEQLEKINNFLILEDLLNTELDRDSIFIRDIKLFQKTSSTLYNTFYPSNPDKPLTEVSSSLDELMDSYSKMKMNYDIINKTLEAETFTFKGELKDNDNKATLGVESAKISIKSKKIFEEEMDFASQLRDSLAKQETKTYITKKASKGINLAKQIEEETFKYYTNAYQLNEDNNTLQPSIVNEKGETVYKFESIDIQTHNRWKVNFSTGYLLSFISDDNYTYRKDNTGIIGVNNSNNNEIKHAIGGLIHAYPRFFDGFQPAISSGVSIDGNGSIGFYFGGSLLFTEKNRFALSVGYSLTSVDRLDRGNLNLNDSNELVFSTPNDIEIRYNNVYKGALFIGVTYNLSE